MVPQDDVRGWTDDMSAPAVPWGAMSLFLVGSAWAVADLAVGRAVRTGDWFVMVALCALTVTAIVITAVIAGRAVRVAAACVALVLCLAGLYRGGLYFLPACLVLVVETGIIRASDRDVLTERRAVPRDGSHA